jgi:hypothetical protein
MEPLTASAGLAFLAVLAVARVLIHLAKQWAHDKKYIPIPGPRQIPFVGRVHDLPLQYTWLKFKEWADEHGPMYITSMFGTKLLVLSDETIVEDLLVKRAKIYSDRPSMRSVVDSKSTHGSMEYLPLMGKNRELNVPLNGSPTCLLTCAQNTGLVSANGPTYRSVNQPRPITMELWISK